MSVNGSRGAGPRSDGPSGETSSPGNSPVDQAHVQYLRATLP